MIDRIYLGTLIDINKEQYLPIMDKSYLISNTLTNSVVSIQKYGDEKIISTDNTTIHIRSAYTSELIKMIVAPRQIRYSPIGDRYKHFAVSSDLTKIYCITSDTTDIIYLSIYDITTDTWEDHLLPTITTTYSTYVTYMIIDETENTIFVYVGQYNMMYKFSLSTFELLAQGPVGTKNSGLSFDGSYLYAMYTASNHSQVKKYDKNTLSIVASSADTYYRSTSTVESGEVFLYNGYLFVSSTIFQSSYNIAKIRTSDMAIVANTGDSIVPAGRMCVDDGKLFGVQTGASKGELMEFDINTLGAKTPTITTISQYNDQVLIVPRYGVVYAGTQAQIVQIESQYSIKGYKKVKEIME